MYSLTLQNAGGDSVITSGDIIGRINFAVPAESDGFSATYISSFINSMAEGPFTSGSNPAGLVFGVSSSDPAEATGVLKISSGGNFLPLASGAYDLGSPTFPFKNLYANGGNVTAHSGVFDIIQFNTNNGSVTSQGQMGWNSTEGTIDIALTDSTVMEIGQHRFFRVRNTTGGPLYKGQVVYASGVHANGIITPSLYIANNTIDEIRFIGLVFDNINNNNNGYVIDFGHLRNLDLDGSATNYAVGDETWLNGDILYAHPTVAGKLTKVKPKHAISLAIILDNASANGQLFVRPTNFGDLSYNHDVDVSGATNGQFLQYNSVTDYWIPSSSGNFNTLLLNGTGVSVNGHTHISSNITDFNTAVSGLIPTITNSGDNRILTSTGSTTGINAESNITFNDSFLDVAGSGLFASGLNIKNQTASTIASFDNNKNLVSLSTSTYPSLTELSYVKGVTSSIQTQLNNPINSSSKTIAFFTASDNHPPATSYATLDTRNSILVLDFDAATTEIGYFTGLIPENTNTGSGLDVRINWSATTATTNNCNWESAFLKMPFDLDSFPTPTAISGASTANTTNGSQSIATLTHASGQIDGLSGGDFFLLRISRLGSSAGDSMVGDAELISVEVRSKA